MKIVIGSLNQTKIQAVETVFPSASVISIDSPSDVSKQPIGDEETRKGAVNRALNALDSQEANFGIGLEGGVMTVDNSLFLCNWGALVDSKGNQLTAAGARIQLPDAFREKLESGTELSDLMDAYTQKADIRHHEGAIGIFTNNLVDRASMFTHVVTLLKGQQEYWSQL